MLACSLHRPHVHSHNGKFSLVESSHVYTLGILGQKVFWGSFNLKQNFYLSFPFVIHSTHKSCAIAIACIEARETWIGYNSGDEVFNEILDNHKCVGQYVKNC